jgi:hypothetical protein
MSVRKTHVFFLFFLLLMEWQRFAFSKVVQGMLGEKYEKMWVIFQ